MIELVCELPPDCGEVLGMMKITIDPVDRDERIIVATESGVLSINPETNEVVRLVPQMELVPDTRPDGPGVSSRLLGSEWSRDDDGRIKLQPAESS